MPPSRPSSRHDKVLRAKTAILQGVALKHLELFGCCSEEACISFEDHCKTINGREGGRAGGKMRMMIQKGRGRAERWIDD